MALVDLDAPDYICKMWSAAAPKVFEGAVAETETMSPSREPTDKTANRDFDLPSRNSSITPAEAMSPSQRSSLYGASNSARSSAEAASNGQIRGGLEGLFGVRDSPGVAVDVCDGSVKGVDSVPGECVHAEIVKIMHEFMYVDQLMCRTLWVFVKKRCNHDVCIS